MDDTSLITVRIAGDEVMDFTMDPLFDFGSPDLTPRDPNVLPQDVVRLSEQCRVILTKLRRGPVTNAELSKIALKYTSRISDLRAAGYTIKAKRLSGGLVEYRLEVAHAS